MPLYIVLFIGKLNVVKVLSCSVLQRQGPAEASVLATTRLAERFHSATKARPFPEHGRNGAVLVLAEWMACFTAGVVELAAETIEQFQLRPTVAAPPHVRRAMNFQGFELLPLLFQDNDHVGGGASPNASSKSSIGRAPCSSTVGIDGQRVSGRARCHEFLFANPLHGSSLHAAPRERITGGELETSQPDSNWLSIRFLV